MLRACFLCHRCVDARALWRCVCCPCASCQFTSYRISAHIDMRSDAIACPNSCYAPALVCLSMSMRFPRFNACHRWVSMDSWNSTRAVHVLMHVCKSTQSVHHLHFRVRCLLCCRVQLRRSSPCVSCAHIHSYMRMALCMPMHSSIGISWMSLRRLHPLLPISCNARVCIS